MESQGGLRRASLLLALAWCLLSADASLASFFWMNGPVPWYYDPEGQGWGHFAGYTGLYEGMPYHFALAYGETRPVGVSYSMGGGSGAILATIQGADSLFSDYGIVSYIAEYNGTWVDDPFPGANPRNNQMVIDGDYAHVLFVFLPPAGGFQSDFSALVGGQEFVDDSGGGIGVAAGLYNHVYYKVLGAPEPTAVPEPASIVSALMGLGLSGAIGRRYCKAKA